jgi:hypothetical protein
MYFIHSYEVTHHTTGSTTSETSFSCHLRFFLSNMRYGHPKWRWSSTRLQRKWDHISPVFYAISTGYPALPGQSFHSESRKKFAHTHLFDWTSRLWVTLKFGNWKCTGNMYRCKNIFKWSFPCLSSSVPRGQSCATCCKQLEQNDWMWYTGILCYAKKISS